MDHAHPTLPGYNIVKDETYGFDYAAYPAHTP